MVEDALLALGQVDTCRCPSVSQDFTWDRLIAPSQKWESVRETLEASQRLPDAYPGVHKNGHILEVEPEWFL